MFFGDVVFFLDNFFVNEKKKTAENTDECYEAKGSI